jgi:hypothetical protein
MQKRTSNDSKTLLRLRWFAIISAAFVISLPLAKYYVPTSGWSVLACALLLTAAFSLGADYLFRRQEAHLTQRMQADASPEWGVILNGVSIGRITDAQYAEIRRTVLRNGRIAFEQLGNIIHTGLAAAAKALSNLPLILIWTLLFATMAFPEDLVSLIQEIQRASVLEIVAFMQDLATLTIALSAATMGLLALLGYDFGYRDCYREAVDRMVRRHCRAAAVGSLHLIRTDFIRERP